MNMQARDEYGKENRYKNEENEMEMAMHEREDD